MTSQKFGQFCKNNSLVVVTAESCTAGLIAATIAQTPGSSAWLESGYVVYSPQAKITMLGVNPETIERFDITSTQVAREMAIGALQKSTANLCLAVTGLAGSTGGTQEIPAGTICMSWIFKKGYRLEIHEESRFFKGERNDIRQDVVEYMLEQAMRKFDACP